TGGTGGVENITFTTTVTGRYVRMYGTARTTGYGFSLWGFEVYGTPAVSNINLASNKTATASSIVGGNTAAMAFDGNITGTRWESASSDPQWITVDLGSSYTVTKAKLTWETAAAKDYKIQVSTDNLTWVDAYSKTGGIGGTENITFTKSVTGRYVRMYGTARTTVYGYSLWDFQVY
ncbi:MAG: discoidin domain-containing protein, partial [Clostridiaceae bacterium]|nr:discoidin domain-containing protein [Clostridiaceae bacterium]